MNYEAMFASFALGFSCALLLIARVSLRPNAKKVLKSVKLINSHKARNPRKLPVVDNHADQEI